MTNRVAYNAIYSLANMEPFSGGIDDPMVIADMDANDYIAFDNRGNKLPYLVRMSIFAHEIDRDVMLLEDLDKAIRRHDQRICVSILLFETEEEKNKYLEQEQ
jgi:hypothetical protein